MTFGMQCSFFSVVYTTIMLCAKWRTPAFGHVDAIMTALAWTCFISIWAPVIARQV